MKNNLTLKLIAVYFLCFHSANAQWQVLNGPYGVETTSSVFLDSLCFSGTINGLAVSNDSGANWSYLNTGINGTQSKLEFNDGKLIYDRFFNTTGGIISLDSGRTWNTMTSLGAFPPVKYAIEAGTIYAWCEYGFLFYSIDNGVSWNAMYQPPSTNNTNCITADNNRLYVSKSSFGTGIGNMYFTDDLGATWDSLPTSGMASGSREVYQLIANGNQLYVVDHFEIYKSTDGGISWSLFTNGLPSNHSTRIFICNDKIYASLDNGGGLFQSDTSSAIFISINMGMPLENPISHMTQKNNKLYASSAAGLFSTDISSINWELSQNGIPFYSCNSIEAIDSTIFVGTYKGFHVSYNNGDNFTSIPLGETTSNFYLEGSDVYACGARGLASSDSGQTWTSINFPYGYYNQNLTDFCKSGNNYLGLNQDGLVKYSANSGNTWTTLTITPSTSVICMTSKGSEIFLGTSNGIYRSTNNGSSWTVYQSSLTVLKLKLVNNVLYAMTSSALYYSSNGSTWQNTNYPGSSPISFTVKNNVIVVSPGLFYTNNFGANWYSISAPTVPFQTGPRALCLTNDYLFAGFYNDTIYRLPSNLITATSEIISQESLFTISPNPVSSELNISFKNIISNSQSMEIYISDYLGRVLLTKFLLGTNENRVSINTQVFSSGVYYVSVLIGGKRVVGRFVKE